MTRLGLLNSITDLIITLINVYTAQGSNWSIIAKITAIVTGICTGTTLTLFLLYNNWLLNKVKDAHELEVNVECSSNFLKL